MRVIALSDAWQRIDDNYMGDDFTPAAKTVLQRVADLFALWCIQRSHITAMYDGGLLAPPGAVGSAPSPADVVGTRVLELCALLRPDAIALVDALAPSDHVRNPVALGHGLQALTLLPRVCRRCIVPSGRVTAKRTSTSTTQWCRRPVRCRALIGGGSTSPSQRPRAMVEAAACRP